MNGLVDEFFAATDGLDDASAAWLRHQGIREMALHLWPGPVGFACIDPDPLGFFDFAEVGRKAYIQPVLVSGEFTNIIDLVAWFHDNPTQWWTRCYSGVPLGIDQLDHAGVFGEPLMLRATPLDWLRSGGDGVCILNAKMCASALRTVPELICETVERGEQVERFLSTPPLRVPLITILEKDLE